MSKLKYLQSLWFSGPQQYNTWWYLPILGVFATVGLPDSCKIQPIYWGVPRRYFLWLLSYQVASYRGVCVCVSQDPLYWYCLDTCQPLGYMKVTWHSHDAENHHWDICVGLLCPVTSTEVTAGPSMLPCHSPSGWAITENDWDAVSSSGCCRKLLAQVSLELWHPDPEAWPTEKGVSRMLELPRSSAFLNKPRECCILSEMGKYLFSFHWRHWTHSGSASCSQYLRGYFVKLVLSVLT